MIHTMMQTLHFPLICLLLMLPKMISSSSNGGNYQRNILGKSLKSPLSLLIEDNKESNIFLKIKEDSDSLDDLAKKILQAKFTKANDLSHSTKEFRIMQEEAGYKRIRRWIFGKDNRVNMRTSREAQMYPFSTAVMLSSGCTGTLIGSHHVLTAAHCVHNGKRLIKTAKQLRVGKSTLFPPRFTGRLEIKFMFCLRVWSYYKKVWVRMNVFWQGLWQN